MNQAFAAYPTGSAYITSREAANDIDIVLLFETFEQAQRHIAELVSGHGWVMCGEDYGDDGTHFKAIRNGDDNQIIVWDYMQFVRWMAFTELAKKLGMVDKVERIELSKALVDANMEAARNICRYSPVHRRMAQVAGQYIASCGIPNGSMLEVL